MKRERRDLRGVTLVEMLVVLTIIALVAGLVGVNVVKKNEVAREVAARAQIESFMTALISFHLDTGVFPTEAQGLRALRVRPELVSGWRGPYLPKEIPNDPWGRPYQYKYPSEHGDEPEIISLGADGQPGGETINADIVSWKAQ